MPYIFDCTNLNIPAVCCFTAGASFDASRQNKSTSRHIPADICNDRRSSNSASHQRTLLLEKNNQKGHFSASLSQEKPGHLTSPMSPLLTPAAVAMSSATVSLCAVEADSPMPIKSTQSRIRSCRLVTARRKQPQASLIQGHSAMTMQNCAVAAMGTRKRGLKYPL